MRALIARWMRHAGSLVLLCLSMSCSDVGPEIPLIVTRVSPDNGPRAGMQAVTLTGHFPEGVRSVFVGGTAATNVRRESATELTATMPARSTAGAVDVTVHTGGKAVTCIGCYSYNPAVTWASVTAGSNHTCGLSTEGKAFCWGDNIFGQLGQGEGMGTTERCDSWELFECNRTPLAVAGGLIFTMLDAGAFTCGVATTGATYCWGDDYPGNHGGKRKPERLYGDLVFSSVDVGGSHACGLVTDGSAYCWGENSSGALGDGSTTRRYSPVAVTGGLKFTAIAAGSGHTCGLASDGLTYCWGENSYHNQLGDGTTISRTTPGPIRGDLRFHALSSGAYHTCGLTADGQAYCWGMNGYKQLGDGSLVDRSVPVPAAGSERFTSLAVGIYHSCGLKSNGDPVCWGGDSRQSPIPIFGASFTTLSAGGSHRCGVTATGKAYCWGSNGTGQLGDGTTIERGNPMLVKDP